MEITSKVENMQPLNFKDREYIEYSLRLKRTLRYIGEHLGRAHTTISREVERNSPSSNGLHLANKLFLGAFHLSSPPFANNLA
jgi:IS30 family transposase